MKQGGTLREAQTVFPFSSPYQFLSCSTEREEIRQRRRLHFLPNLAPPSSLRRVALALALGLVLSFSVSLILSLSLSLSLSFLSEWYVS